MKILKKLLLLIAIIGLIQIHVSAQQCASIFQPASACSAQGQWGVIEPYNSGTNSFPCNSLNPNINPDNFNCHQYVRGALEKGWVNLFCGAPTTAPCSRSGSLFSSLASTNINSDNKYIKLCNASYAQAISFDNSDHSAVLLTNGFYASTPGWGSDLLYHTIPAWGAGSCVYSYYAYMGNISVAGDNSTLIAGSTRTFTIIKPAYITTVTWTVDTRYLEIQSGQGTTSLTVKGKCGAGYSGIKAAYVTATLSNGCDTTPPTFTRNFNVDCGINPCEGTINGNYLNTVNGVTANYSNTVAMNGSGPYTWTKTSGTTNYWYTGSNGKYLYFSVPSGATANFNVVGSGCNRTIGFATGFGYRVMNSNGEQINSITVREDSEKKVKFRVIEFMSGKTLQEGVLDVRDQEKIFEGFGSGFYVLEIDGERKKIFKQ